MIFRQSILCWILIVNLAVQNVRAISIDDIFEYVLDAIDDSDDVSDELANSSLNVTCKNCTLSVECHNCTHSHTDTQSTIPMQTPTQNNQQTTSPSLPTPTIPAPEISSSSSNAPSQSVPITIATPVPSAATTNPQTPPTTQATSTKSLDNGNLVLNDGATAAADLESSTNTNDGVTGGDELTSK